VIERFERTDKDNHQFFLSKAYNPNLGEVTRATRQAYVKFMVPKIKKDGDAPSPAKVADAGSKESVSNVQS
jgi:hypothetical protein